MKLFEIKQLTPEEQLEQDWKFLKRCARDLQNITRNADGSYNVFRAKIPENCTRLKVRFAKCTMGFTTGGKLTSLEGCPIEVGSFMMNSPLISTLDHVPMVINHQCHLDGPGIKSFAGVHKMRPNWKVEHLIVSGKTATNLMGLALIPGIKTLMVRTVEANIWFRRGDDPHEFQEQLIDAGLIAQARL